MELALDREIEKREESDKYRHHLAEDVQTRYAAINLGLGNITEAMRSHIIACAADKIEINGRLKSIERLIWIAVGGVAVLGALIGIVGGNIMRLLSHG